MWAFERVFYQFYPLGLTGAPFHNDSTLSHRIGCVGDWIPHLKKLGIGAVYFSPVFDSDSHGYDTRDYRKIDPRLGTNEDFAAVCRALHEADIKVILDGVFNHVGRGFWAFRDVQEHRWDSPYKDWFFLNFDGNSAYDDGFWYEGWEGHYELVKLNLRNPAVTGHLLECVKQWIDEFDIDGLRLDVAYMLDRDFLKYLRWQTSRWKEDFFLLGEILHGDYKTIMNGEMCHSVTNYECYKGLYSSFNSRNLFEIVHSLLRQFGKDPWCLYQGQHLVSFVDNHDVSRIASTLTDPNHVKLIYTLMYGMPGIPMIYYGSEWGFAAHKSQGDPALRPAFDGPEWNDLTDHIAALSAARTSCNALQYGDFTSLVLTNCQCVFRRECGGERVYTAVNLDGSEFCARFDAGCEQLRDLISGQTYDCRDGLVLPGYSSMLLIPA